MRTAENWTEYTLLDASGGERLERWGDVVLIRPDPQVIWNTPRTDPLWKHAHARYRRSSTGGGQWERFRPIPESWQIGYGGLRFHLKPMGFKHTGLFPEQSANWDFMAEKIRRAGREPRVLNLFAYTGGATLACAAAGASVTHVDAAKSMVAWAKENAALSGLSGRPIRYIVDDCMKFVLREQRRGRTYDGILMDPPSYGRGAGGQVWKVEEDLCGLVAEAAKLLSDHPLFFIINSYTTGLSAVVTENLLNACVTSRYGGHVEADNLVLPVEGQALWLPCGTTARWQP